MSLDGNPGPPTAGQDDTRAVTASPDGDRRAEQPATQPASTNDAPSQQRPESLSREEYADAVRESGPPIRGARDDHQSGAGSEPRGHANSESGRPAGHGPAEPRDPEIHGNGTRAEAGEREGADLTVADSSARGQGAHDMRGDGPDPRVGSDVASGASGDGTGSPPADDETDAAALAVTHFHAEFKGRPIDLYPDGSRWAAADQARREDTVAGQDEIPDRPPTGEELVESADEEASRPERFWRELYRESDEALDKVEKSVNGLHDIFSPPATGSHAGIPADGPYISAAQHSGVDAGAIASAVLVVGVVIDRGIRGLVQHYQEHAKGE